jgi:hypothetical protein
MKLLKAVVILVSVFFLLLITPSSSFAVKPESSIGSTTLVYPGEGDPSSIMAPAEVEVWLKHGLDVSGCSQIRVSTTTEGYFVVRMHHEAIVDVGPPPIFGSIGTQIVETFLKGTVSKVFDVPGDYIGISIQGTGYEDAALIYLTVYCH